MKQGKIVAIVFMFIMLMVTQKLIAVYPLTRTYSISPDSLHQIRAAAGLVAGETSDALIAQYWTEYTRSFRDETPDPGDLQRDRSYTDSFGFEPQAIKAYTAVLNYENNSPQYSDDIDDIRTYLFTFPWEIYQNALKYHNCYPGDLPGVVPTEWDADPNDDDESVWWDLDEYQRAREMSYNLLFMSYIVDMLYYAYADTTLDEYTQVHDPVNGILKNLQDHVKWIHETFFNYGTPNSPTNGWDSIGWNIDDLYAPGDGNRIAPLGMCYDANENSDGIFLPRIDNAVSRFHLVCGMGYASIITQQDSLLNTFVKNEFKSSSPLPAETSYHGFNDYLTTNSGMYVGGLTYQNRLLYLSNLFLTALNRTKGINLYDSTNDWNCDMIPRMVRYTLKRIDPELHHITYGDDWRYNGVNPNGGVDVSMDHSIQIERGLLSFYYQNTDDYTSQDDIRWYVNRLEGNSGAWPREIYEHDFATSFEVVMSYRDDSHEGPGPFTAYAPIPSSILHGTYSDAECTILRSTASDYSEFQNTHMLVVNHENSFIPYHNNDDSTTFQFYLWGKPVIVEPGYVPYFDGAAKYSDWYQSSFSQNLLIVNPANPKGGNRLDEGVYLSKTVDEVGGFTLKYEDPMNLHKWPISWLTQYQDNRPYFNKAKKQYLIRNINSNDSNDIEHLRIHFKYNNSKTNSFDPTNENTGYDNFDKPCNVFRNFYKVADKYYIILDNAMFVSPPDSLNIFRNQMHLLTHVSKRTGDWTGDIALNQLPGVHLYTVTGPKKMYIAMGSSIDSTPAFDLSDQSITKLAWTPYDATIDTGLMQKLSMTASSDNNQEYFITLLYPSESPDSVNPITEAIQDDSGYRLIASEGTRKVFVSLCSDSTLVFPSENYRLDTDGDFLVLDTESDISIIHEMILSRGTELTVYPLQGTGFPAQDVFKSYTEAPDEVIASWIAGNLHVAFKTNQAQFPRYRIKRCGVLPSGFFSKTEYGLEVLTEVDTTASLRGTIANNIQSLAYDPDFFYVNFSWEDLVSAGFLTDGLVFVQGNVPETSINASITFQGIINVQGNITVGNSGSLTIAPGSALSVSSGVGIFNHGSLVIDGGTTHSISIGNLSQQWGGITTYRDGDLVCDHANVVNASTGVLVRGTATITNSEIRNCYRGLSVEIATPFTIAGNSITNNTYGVTLSNNYSTSNSGYLNGNEITQNGFGVVLYNSNTMISSNNIHANTRGGLYLIRGSDPIVKGNNISYSENANAARPEITLESDSYPVIKDHFNDINADGLGYSLYYASTGRIEKLDATNNYWGSTDAGQIRSSFYPTFWPVVFEPYNTEPNTAFLYIGDNLFKQALAAEDSGDTALAKQLYSLLVATEPDSLYALQSLGRLNSIYSGSTGLLSELRDVYDVYASTCADSLLIKCAQIKSIMLDRFERMYHYAVLGYENLLPECTTELDSLLCLLDIAYTLQDMYYEDQDKGALTGISYSANGIHVSTLKEAKHTVNRLWDKLMAVSEIPSGLMVPVPHKLDATNYPNPFNPSTTIALSLPNEGRLRVTIYNARGQRVRELANENMPRGFHKVVWDGRDNRNSSVSSGLYFVRIEADNTSVVKKIMMLK